MVARSTADQLPCTSRLDTICVLDKGIICNTLPNGTYDALPAPGSNLQICRTDQSLLLFYALLSRYFNQAQMPCFRFTDYLGNMAFEDRASA